VPWALVLQDAVDKINYNKGNQLERFSAPFELRTRFANSNSCNVRFWPFFPVNEGFNGAESDFRFTLESGR